MAPDILNNFLESTRGRVIALIRQAGKATVEEIASAMGLTANAVRVQLTVLERDGLIRRSGQRPGPTRPAQLYEVSSELEQLLSRAYIPLTSQLVAILGERLPPEEVAQLMRESGRRLAAALSSKPLPDGPLSERVRTISTLLNQEIGAVTDIEPGPHEGFILRGRGCPLAALTGAHKPVCLAVEALISVAIDADVRECCDVSTERPKCCFEIRERSP